MADVVLSTVNLDVFGGPTSLDVSVDFGQTGVRGTRTWVGAGDPSSILANQPVQLYDLFINTNTIDPFYGWLYQYILEVGSPAWVRVLRLNPSQYSAQIATAFTTGTGTIVVPISLLTSDAGTTAAKYTIRYSIEDTSPVATAFTYTVDSNNINITVKAASWNGTTWSNLNGVSKDVHLFISYLSS
jgi:hypothetical protein